MKCEIWTGTGTGMAAEIEARYAAGWTLRHTHITSNGSVEILSNLRVVLVFLKDIQCR